MYRAVRLDAVEQYKWLESVAAQTGFPGQKQPNQLISKLWTVPKSATDPRGKGRRGAEVMGELCMRWIGG